MTVENILPFTDFVGDGIVTSFPFNFRVDFVTTVNVNFTDNFNGFSLNIDQDDNAGGSAEYSVAPLNGQAIHIERSTPIVQSMDYTRYDPFDSTSHEGNLDKLTMIIQELLAGSADSIANNQDQIDNLQTQIDNLIILADGHWQFATFSGDRTLILSDDGKMLKATGSGTPQVVTIPQNSNVNFELGTQISLFRKGPSDVSWVGEGPVVINSPASSSIARLFGTITFIQEAIDIWMVTGDITQI